MALPEDTLSGTFVPSQLISPDNRPITGLTDWERGGVAIQNATQGINAFDWLLSVIGDTVTLTREGALTQNVFSRPGIQEISFSFDQNMNPAFVYKVDGIMYLRWFDSFVNQIVTTNFGPGRTPKLSMDDKRTTSLNTNDIIFAYLRDDELLYRQQRDRFTIERVLKTDIDPAAELEAVGMSNTLRLYFKFKPFLILPSCVAPGGPGGGGVE